MRLDTDAILLGGAFASRASAFFEQHPAVGVLGCYRTNYAGAGRVWDYPRSRIRGMLTREAIKDPARARRVAWLLARAYASGKLRRDRYEMGEFISGGATIYSHRCVRAGARGAGWTIRGWRARTRRRTTSSVYACARLACGCMTSAARTTICRSP